MSVEVRRHGEAALPCEREKGAEQVVVKVGCRQAGAARRQVGGGAVAGEKPLLSQCPRLYKSAWENASIYVQKKREK